ncbi:hypothetical protein [Streptomyces sp. NPDC086023]|uniref:hypothetical protein n=1 Tax=Streptomyces sp. NPDC086023 TaxID=3365746 RepID=UPI0037D7B7A7
MAEPEESGEAEGRRAAEGSREAENVPGRGAGPAPGGSDAAGGPDAADTEDGLEETGHAPVPGAGDVPATADGSVPGAGDVPGGAGSSSPVSLARWGLGLLGVLLIGIGGRHLSSLPDPYAVLVWLGGALVLHDGVVAPLVLAVGLLVAALPARPVVRAALVTAGALVLVTLPLLLRPGAPPNPSALPLPYARNLLLVLAVVAGCATAAALLARLRRRRHPRGPGGDRKADAPA